MTTEIDNEVVKRRNHWILAKRSHGDLIPVTYTNRAQAMRKIAELGDDWTLYQYGRPFLVGLKESSARAIVADYKERAASAREAGATCEIDTAMETVLIHDSTGEDYYHHGHEAQEFIDEANQTLHDCNMEGMISLEDYFLAIHG
jgi:hypothetical protein